MGYGFDELSVIVLGHLLRGLGHDDVVRATAEDCRARGISFDAKKARICCLVLPDVAFVKQLFAA